MRPRPFLNGQVAKSTHARDYGSLAGGDIEPHIEPFLGGGAVFLELARQGEPRPFSTTEIRNSCIHGER